MEVREATHSGSWYSDSQPALTRQLDQWLSQVPDDIPGIGKVPIPGSRVVISPHAGYAYSGPAAAWAYKSLDLSKAKRIFILHPSHHHHLTTAALPVLTAYSTPLSQKPLPLDRETIAHLSSLTTTSSQGRTVKFTTMTQAVDEAEHSAEMQLPYLHRLLQLLHPTLPESAYPPLVPIMVGSTNPSTEAALGKFLAPYIASPENVFVISSDFCHWGSRFGYTYYLPDAPTPALSPLTLPNGVRATSDSESGPNPAAANEHDDTTHQLPTLSQGTNLRSSPASSNKTGSVPRIHESIAHADRACMCAIASGSSAAFLRVLHDTGNTVCGRHPIGVFMAGLEEVERQGQEQHQEEEREDNTAPMATESILDGKRFKFIRYERSSDVLSMRDSSVSYVSAFAVL